MSKDTKQEQGELIAAAEKNAKAYDGDDREGIKTDVINAFYQGAAWQARATLAPIASTCVSAPASQVAAQQAAAISDVSAFWIDANGELSFTIDGSSSRTTLQPQQVLTVRRVGRALSLVIQQAAAVAAPSKLPKWIDDHKGADPFMDDVIAYIETLLSNQGAATTSEDARYRWLRDEAIYQQEGNDGWYEIKVPAPLQDDVEVTAEQFDMQVQAAMRTTQQEGGK